MINYDVIIIGSGPGGYVSAIRASQLGFKTAIIEKEDLGGICLNWGCIPTKALLKSAQVFNYINYAENYGFDKVKVNFKFSNIIQRSRNIAKKMSKGVEFLMKKNRIDIIWGRATLKSEKKIIVSTKNGKNIEYFAHHIIIATGSRAKEISILPHDGKKIIGYREAISLQLQPRSLIIIGSGAIGVEFAYFYASMGSKVTLIEYMPRIIPIEDPEISFYLQKSLEKIGITILTESSIENLTTTSTGVVVSVNTSKGKQILQAEIIISAIGIQSNIENIGLEEIGIKIEKNKIIVDDFYQTNIDGYYAIGDVISTPSLAHVASAEGIICINHIKGIHVEKINYNNIPICIYCVPEIASVGYTEEGALKAGYNIKVGRFPFSANGKATSNGDIDGFVKVIFDAKYGEWLGCHLIGNGVTEIISEAVIARQLETTGKEILKSIHPHPTLSEVIIEAVSNAYKEAIHI